MDDITKKELSSIMDNPEYAIAGFVTSSDEIIFFAERITPSQADIPTTIQGRNVTIVKSL